MPNKTRVVHRDSEILSGTPVFVGTRVPVQSLFDNIQNGDTLDEFSTAVPIRPTQTGCPRIGTRALDDRSSCDCRSMSGRRAVSTTR